MSNKRLFGILILVVLMALFTLSTLVGADRYDEEDALSYIPVILLITGTPPPTVTPPSNTPTPTATATPIARHFDDCAFRTANNATVAVPADVTINGDLVLAIDDEIAVFTPDGSICAGMTPWAGNNIAITAWGDDAQTAEVDGLRDGEEMIFRIWDKSANEEVLVKTVSYALGNGIYMTDGIFAVSVFSLN